LETSWYKSKFFFFVVKAGISLAGLWYVFSKLNIEKTLEVLTKINWISFLLAFAFFNISKLLSAIRQQNIYQSIGINIHLNENFKLYYIGMFYNLILPGGIGGDGYKTILLKRIHNKSWKSLIGTNVVDRLSGLVALTGILYFLIFFTIKTRPVGSFLFIVLFLFGFLFYYRIFSNYFSVYKKVFIKIHIHSLGVQIAQIVSVFFLLFGLNEPGFNIQYIILFLVSSIAAVLPITIGGLGAREFIALEGSKYLDTDKEIALTLSILFFLITVLSSFIGFFFKPSEPDPVD
jgi:hypothetical protein